MSNDKSVYLLGAVIFGVMIVILILSYMQQYDLSSSPVHGILDKLGSFSYLMIGLVLLLIIGFFLLILSITSNLLRH